MHVNERTRKIAFLASMTAVSTVLLLLGTYISVNTVFFTALAAFLVGITIAKYNLGAGIMLFMGSAILDLFINPNKFHVFLYFGMAGFILLAEGSYIWFEKKIQNEKKRSMLHLICRFLIFMALYLPLVFIFPSLLVGQTWLLEISWFLPALAVAGIVFFVIYDLAYLYVKKYYYQRFGGKI